MKLFQSHQQTRNAFEEWSRWLGGRQPESLKVSFPPFNDRGESARMLPMTKKYNVPNFGVMIPKAVMPLFESDEIKALATELNIRIPKYMLDSFVQKKMWKVKVLVKAARDLGGWDEQADRLERFATAFENLAVDEIRGPDEWKRFVEGHVAEGWESRLHFDHVLQNFGFDDDAAKQLRGAKHTETDPKSGEETTQDLETFSFRWLGKAFSGYSVKGCLTDVVNLLFAMAELYDDGKEDQKKLAESEIAGKITEVVTKVNKGDLSGLWVPTHIVHDSESDDLLCWLLLEHIHKKLGSDLQVLVQFPPVRRAAARTSPRAHPYSALLTAAAPTRAVGRDRPSGLRSEDVGEEERHVLPRPRLEEREGSAWGARLAVAEVTDQITDGRWEVQALARYKGVGELLAPICTVLARSTRTTVHATEALELGG